MKENKTINLNPDRVLHLEWWSRRIGTDYGENTYGSRPVSTKLEEVKWRYNKRGKLRVVVLVSQDDSTLNEENLKGLFNEKDIPFLTFKSLTNMSATDITRYLGYPNIFNNFPEENTIVLYGKQSYILKRGFTPDMLYHIDTINDELVFFNFAWINGISEMHNCEKLYLSQKIVEFKENGKVNIKDYLDMINREYFEKEEQHKLELDDIYKTIVKNKEEDIRRSARPGEKEDALNAFKHNIRLLFSNTKEENNG